MKVKGIFQLLIDHDDHIITNRDLRNLSEFQYNQIQVLRFAFLSIFERSV